jgi:tRNA-specific 2-thiouridylase
VSWIAGSAPEKQPIQAQVRIRHKHVPEAASIAWDEGSAARIRFDTPVRAVAPGQAAVFYRGDQVLGGGWIVGPLE